MNFLSIFTLGLALTLVAAEIKQINVLFRHGDRTPGNFLKTCPNCTTERVNSSSFYPIGLGGLTNTGKKRAYDLGRLLRSSYNNLLGAHYLASDVEAVSTESGRTRMTLQLVLAGLYPPSRVQKWCDEVDWQPALTSFLPMELDSVFVPQKCEEYTKEYRRVLHSPEFQRRCEKLAPFLAKLGESMGRRKACPLTDANHLYHTLVAARAMNSALPAWSSGMFPEGELRESALMQYRLYGYNDKLRRLGGGVLLRKIIGNMRNARRKVHLYSGHELNVVMLMQAMGIYEDRVPEYTSAVIVELHEVQGRRHAKVLYHRGIPSEVQVLRIPGCEELCPFERFTQLLRRVTPSDEDLICRRVHGNGEAMTIRRFSVP